MGLAEALSAEDETPPIFGGGVTMNTFADSGTDPLSGISIGKPAAAQPSAQSLVVVSTTTSGAPVVDVNLTQPATGLLGAWYWVRNQIVYGIPGLFTSAKNRVASMFAPASSSSAKVASSDSSWMLYALLAGAAAAAYFYFKGGKKGKKSIFPKFGGKAAIKLH